MTTRLSEFEEFLLLFNELKRVSKNNAARLVTFYNESSDVRDVANRLESFLIRTDFERRLVHGPRKVFRQAPDAFESAWLEFENTWSNALATVMLGSLGFAIQASESDEPAVETLDPDPEYEGGFNPSYHDGGAALALGIEYLTNVVETNLLDRHDVNQCRIGLDAFNYLTHTIGINPRGVFRRWRKVPLIFMPARVSNKYGDSDRGSLFDLLDDAIRAYVCGAPAASIAMCRAALEMVLKHHYGRGRWEDVKLGRMIILASEKFDFIQAGRIRPLVDQTNKILHEYSGIDRMDHDDDRAILEFLKTVKFLIQRAPAK